MKKISLAFLALCLATISYAQVFTFGDGTNTNGEDGRPGPYSTNWQSAKYQYVVTAEEMQAQGMGEGIIEAIGFDVANLSGVTMQDYTVSMGSFNGIFTFQFVTSAEAQWGPTDYDPTIGWNTHAFAEGYYWDGVTDLIIETCFANGGGGGGGGNDNHETYYTEYPGQLISWSSDANGGGANACDDTDIEDFFQTRPNIQLTWSSVEVPPVAVIGNLNVTACSGVLSAEDQSFYIIDEWLWYFGDGSTSTEQNPIHQYSADGIYDISLVVTNSWGTDSITIVNGAVVNTPITSPTSASCIPQTVDNSAGFGPILVELNGQSVVSDNGSVGYEDFTCTVFNLTEGETYDLLITSDGSADKHSVAWIDYNGDGDFTDNEKIISAVNSGIASDMYTVPSGALIDSTLRMRVISDFYLLGEPDPCADPQGGQAEDYSVIISPNILPPTADFDVNKTYSCDGLIQFSDLSENVPENWLWEFGDTQVSTEQNPEHTYTSSGVYTVELTVQNDFGQDNVIYTDLITIDLSQQLTPAACTPVTLSYCCGYGVSSVAFADILNPSADGVEGYQDFSCDFTAEVTAEEANLISVETGTENPQDVHVLVDLNNDGAFTNDELLFSSFNANIHSGDLIIPASAVQYEPLRMRVIGDVVGNGNTGCGNPQFGQVEDYAIIIYPDTTPPTANFIATPLFTCDGLVNFSNMSEGDFNEVTWHFGDGVSSMENDPDHTYTSSGVYTVSLVASNDFGQDSLALIDYITVNFDADCDTLTVPEFGNEIVTECSGILTDDGGPNEDYSNNSDGSFTITVDADNTILLFFLEFQFQNNDDLLIYDGPDMNSPLIGAFTGNGLPNGGTIMSTGNSITIAQDTNPFGNQAGFILQWECQPSSLSENGLSNGIYIYPNPAENDLSIRVNSPNTVIQEIIITDMSGRVVMRDTSPDYHGAIMRTDLSGMDAGTYIFETLTNQGRSASQIVITR